MIVNDFKWFQKVWGHPFPTCDLQGRGFLIASPLFGACPAAWPARPPTQPRKVPTVMEMPATWPARPPAQPRKGPTVIENPAAWPTRPPTQPRKGPTVIANPAAWPDWPAALAQRIRIAPRLFGIILNHLQSFSSGLRPRPRLGVVRQNYAIFCLVYAG